ncbi:LPS biosynthesis protein [Limnohabitans sp. T6-5]|uniref:LPS-assembly protein LptD n=1 Tax=Limnohabitans sp. T6-5 TaxID=1100724 RepID=UPI000D3C320C|nr:LPS assembly protein LptD [Limnohabitans sp. T6-5]PUE06321.1 LPS biosynthesis protein [Limnohabitans sp. T6-5]
MDNPILQSLFAPSCDPSGAFLRSISPFVIHRFALPSLSSASDTPCALRAVAVAVLLALHGGQVQAQAQGLSLRSSPMLEERISNRQQSEGAVFVEGDQVIARPDMDLQIQGQATIRRPGLSLRGDRLDYDQTQDVVNATGQVRVSRDSSLFVGPRLTLQMDSFKGTFEKPQFELYGTGGYGSASEVEFVDDKQAIVRQASYTTCRRTPGPEWLPEWVLKATQMTIDEEESRARAENVQLRFFDVPILASPVVSFPLTSGRQSGLLPPLVGVDTTSGVLISQPYYIDLAPNRDLTVTTEIMSKRGVAADSEFRYLEPDYKGQVRLNMMPSDSLRHENRWGLTSQHSGSIETGIDGVGRVGLGLTLNRVSDDNYWRDFPRAGLALTQRLLPSTGVLSWGRGDFSMTALVQRWQTLQSIDSVITPPYDRAPQITMRYGQWNPEGLDWSVVGDTTRFEADYSRMPNSTSLPRNGERSYVQAQLSRPWIRPWGFVTPKVQLHATRYQMDRALEDGSTSVNRVLPTFSVDSGLVFERETQWFDRDVVQTLEPRAFYARTPYRDQHLLPVYDSGPADFNLSTIYSENPYVGQDRLVDNNAVTLGVNSRFFDATTGAEMLRVGVAQRIRFTDQQVVLPGQPAASSGVSDLLLGAGIRWDDRWALDSTVQINSQTDQVSRSTVQARYSPTPYRVFNVAYRLNNQLTPTTELVDVGWQWPLSDLLGRSDRQAESAWTRAPGQGLGPDRWYSVGRLNFSLKENRVVDSLLGLEYDAGCWLGRIAFERLQSTVTTASSRLLFQIEFVGLASVGASPLQSLKTNIPRYQFLRDNTVQPSRFQHYE